MINWGIIGLGNMANTFAHSLREIKDCKLKAIASLDKSRVEKFGEKFNVEKSLRFNSYKNLINSKDIDAIYISTLNNTHANLIKQAALASKHVLCEKPISINRDEILDIYKTVKNSNIFFLEGIAYRSHSYIKKLIEILETEFNNDIISIEASFGFNVKKINPNSRLFNKDIGGGAILDVGCYPLSLLNLIANLSKQNKEIKLLDTKANFCSTGVDEFSEANYLISSKIKANIKVAIRKQLKNEIIINGQNGFLKISEPWVPSKKIFIEINLGKNYHKKFITSEISVYANQINHFNNAIRNNVTKLNFPFLTLDDSLKIAELSLDWRKKIS